MMNKYFESFSPAEVSMGFCKLGKSNKEIGSLCYENHDFIKHNDSSYILDNNTDGRGMPLLSFTRADHILIYLAAGYGDELVTLSFDKKHKDADKVKDCDIVLMNGVIMAYHCTGYLTEEVINLNDIRAMEYIIKHNNDTRLFYDDMVRIKHFMYKIGALEAYDYLSQHVTPVDIKIPYELKIIDY